MCDGVGDEFGGQKRGGLDYIGRESRTRLLDVAATVAGIRDVSAQAKLLVQVGHNFLPEKAAGFAGAWCLPGSSSWLTALWVQECAMRRLVVLYALPEWYEAGNSWGVG